MLPPLAPAVLERNPRFKELYRDLTTSRLNPDATTRLIKQQRTQQETEKNLQTLREELIQIDIVIDSLQNIDTTQNSLTSAFLETCQFIAAEASGQLTPDEAETLREDINFSQPDLNLISKAISGNLTQLQTTLCKFLTVDETSSPANLAKDVAALRTAIVNQRAAILQARSRIADLAEQSHVLHREVLESSIRILEQVLHGSAARGLKTRAEHLATVAKGLDLKIQIMHQTDPIITDGRMTLALSNYKAQAESVERTLDLRRNALETQLAEYARGGGGMLEIAKKFAELQLESEDLKNEIRRLE